MAVRIDEQRQVTQVSFAEAVSYLQSLAKEEANVVRFEWSDIDGGSLSIQIRSEQETINQ